LIGNGTIVFDRASHLASDVPSSQEAVKRNQSMWIRRNTIAICRSIPLSFAVDDN
jgi:hypothetical protein